MMSETSGTFPGVSDVENANAEVLVCHNLTLPHFNLLYFKYLCRVFPNSMLLPVMDTGLGSWVSGLGVFWGEIVVCHYKT